MIYFIQEAYAGPIKIGYSKNVWKRMHSLRSSNPNTLILLGVLEGDRLKEKEIHQMFEKITGEWFTPSPALLDFIRLNCDESLLPCPLLDRMDFD